MRVALPKVVPPSRGAACNQRLIVEGTLRTGPLVSVGKNRGPELLNRLRSQTLQYNLSLPGAASLTHLTIVVLKHTLQSTFAYVSPSQSLFSGKADL